MKYSEYIDLRSKNKIVAGIGKSQAEKLMYSLPTKYKYPQAFWSFICLASIPIFICVSIFLSWWLGLLLLFFVTPLIFKATSQSAVDFVLEHAEENEQFFNFLVENKLLVFKEI